MTGVLNAEEKGYVMTNPRRELCKADYTYIAAFASIWDCRLVASLYGSDDLITGCLFKIDLPIDNNIPDVLLYGYIICTNNYNCIKDVNINNILYIVKENNYTLLVLDDENEYHKVVECLRSSGNKKRGMLCLNEISDLKEQIECITSSKTSNGHLALSAHREETRRV